MTRDQDGTQAPRRSYVDPPDDSARPRPRRRPVTSREVAEAAGVSQSAVSRSFTANASVSQETRARVLAAAQQLGYRPNVFARSLITQRSQLIGLVMGEWGNPFYAAMLRRFSEQLRDRGYQVMLLTRDHNGEVDESIRLLLQYRVDGILLESCMASDAMLRECEDAGTSVVGIASGASGAGMTRIFTNSERTGSQVAAFLLAAGYRQFALLRGDASLQTSARRARGFVETLERAGEGGVLVERSGVFGYDAGRACIVELVRSGTRPDAVFCASDSTAVGVLDGARLDLGISVPDELAVVGFGDTPVAAWGCTSLTSVRVPVEQIVDLAIEALVGEPVPRPGRVVCVETDIVQRGTVRPVANPR